MVPSIAIPDPIGTTRAGILNVRRDLRTAEVVVLLGEGEAHPVTGVFRQGFTIGLAQFANWIRKSANFELVTEPRLALLSFRYRPERAQSDAELDRINQRLPDTFNDEGYLYLTKTRARGRLVIRFVIGQTTTTQEHVKQAWSHIQQIAERS